MAEPIPWAMKQRLIRIAHAERTRCMQEFFLGGFFALWRWATRFAAPPHSGEVDARGPWDRDKAHGPP